MDTRTDYFKQAVLDHIYLNADIANIGDAAGLQNSVAAGNLYAALFTASAEADYTDYARIAIPRTAGGFTRSGNVMSNTAQISFVKASGGTNVITRVAIYDALTDGNQLHIQTLGTPITVTTNIQPIIEAAALTITAGDA